MSVYVEIVSAYCVIATVIEHLSMDFIDVLCREEKKKPFLLWFETLFVDCPTRNLNAIALLGLTY
jgi:hypothetical protein